MIGFGIGAAAKIIVPVLLGLGIFFGLVGTLHNSGVRSAQRDVAVQELEHAGQVTDFTLEQMRWIREREQEFHAEIDAMPVVPGD